MKKVTYYYVRHGQTEFNVEGRMQGWCDSPLTEGGIKDAYKAKEDLKDVPFKRAYSSDFPRCKTTAGIILEDRDIEITYSEKLRETNFGALEGLLIKDYFEDIDYRRRVTLDWSDIGGENMEMEQKRVKEIYREIYDACDDGDMVLVVSHGAVFMHMLNYMFHISMQDYLRIVGMGANKHVVPNGLVCIFTCDGNSYEMQWLHGVEDSVLKSLKRVER